MRLNELTSDNWEFIADREVKTQQGILRYFKGIPYAYRMYYSRLNNPNYLLRALDALAVVKKFILAFTYFPVVPRTLSLKKWEEALSKILAICDHQLGQFLIKDDEWSSPVWEIGKFIKLFVEKFFSKEIAYICSRIVMAIFEYDVAWRYRVQDVAGEVKDFTNPRKELKRLYLIWVKREQDGIKETRDTWNTYDRAKKLLTPLLWLLLIPKVKKAFKETVKQIDFNKIKMDDNDRYYVSFWHGYSFGGKNFDTRYQFFLDTHKGDFPPFRKKEDPELTAKFMLGE